MMSSEREIIFEQKNSVGVITLNRPKALNALTHEMCIALDQQLVRWADDDSIALVLIKGAGEKAFCAGGDIVKLYKEGTTGGDYPFQFYRDEYVCDARVKHFSKPYIALVDGIVMGGGVGVSVHGSHRIATERTLFAMPETGIGLFPDVGGSYFLPRCPGKVGFYLGLTGARLKAADCLYAGIATHYVPSEKLQALESEIVNSSISNSQSDHIDTIVSRYTETLEGGSLVAHRQEIDQHFAGDDIQQIIGSLENDTSEWAKRTLDTLLQKSPTSLHVTVRQLTTGAKLDFNACMQMEWAMVNQIIKGVDFYEGTRAVVIDKDQNPKWKPAEVKDVSKQVIDEYFDQENLESLQLMQA